MSWFKRVESFLEKVDDSVNARLNNDDDDDSYEDSYEEEGEYDRIEGYENDSSIPEEERKDALGFVAKELSSSEPTQGDQPNKDVPTSTSSNVTTAEPSAPNESPAPGHATNEAVEKVIRENKIFRAEILKQAKEIDRLKKDDIRLRTLELEATTNKELIETLRGTLDEAIRDKAALEAELASEVEGHRATRENAQQREEQLESYIETYVASISAANTQLQEKEGELTDTKDALIALQSDNDKLRGEIESLKLLNADLEAKLQSQSKESITDGNTDEEKKKKEEQQEQEKEDEEKEGEKEREYDTLRKSLEDSLRTIEELREKISEVTAKSDALEQDLGRFTNAAKEKDELIVQLTQDSDKTAQALSDAKKEVLRLEGEAKALSERASKAEGAADKLRRQLAAKSVLSAEHMQLEARVRVLTDSLGAAQAQLEDIVNENQRLHILAGATPEEAAEAARKYTAGAALPRGGRREGESPKDVAGTLTRFVYQNFDTFERSFAAKYLLPFAGRYDAVEMKAQHIFGSSFLLRIMVYLYVIVIQVWWFIVVLRDLSEQ